MLFLFLFLFFSFLGDISRYLFLLFSLFFTFIFSLLFYFFSAILVHSALLFLSCPLAMGRRIVWMEQEDMVWVVMDELEWSSWLDLASGLAMLHVYMVGHHY